MQNLNFQDILDKKNVFAVVGASNNKNKYGYKVYKLLKDNGYKVFPVNLNSDKIQGDKAYAFLKKIPEKIDVVSVITPPKISEKILEQAENLEIQIIWFQPGAESKNIIEKQKKYQLEIEALKNSQSKYIPQIIVNQCILLNSES